MPVHDEHGFVRETGENRDSRSVGTSALLGSDFGTKRGSDRAEQLFNAFCHEGSCRHSCDCGRNYFDDANGGWDWEEGELERKRAAPEWIACDGSIRICRIEGREYADWCDCWHERLDRIAGFILSHGHGIATFINADAKRAENEAKSKPKPRVGLPNGGDNSRGEAASSSSNC